VYLALSQALVSYYKRKSGTKCRLEDQNQRIIILVCRFFRLRAEKTTHKRKKYHAAAG
jgi:hypothetical protein